MRVHDSGRLRIEAVPADAARAELWGVRPLRHDIRLPAGGGVRSESAVALMTLHGQLFVRVNV